MSTGQENLEVAVVRFEGENKAVEAYAAARDAVPYLRSSERPRWTHDVGFVERHHSGRLLMRGTFAGHYLDVDEGDRVSERGAGDGAAAGGLIGVLGGPPGIAVGLLAGGLIGGNAASPDRVEWEPAALAERLRDAVPRSFSAIVMFAAADQVDEMVAAVGGGAQGTVRRPLTDEEASALEAALRDAPTAVRDRSA
jgi:hypothetical protein